MDDVLQCVHDFLLSAKKKQIDAFEIEAIINKGFSVTARQGNVEQVEHHREKSLHITVYKDQKTGNASTSDLSAPALEATLEKACAIANYTEPDAFSGLADATQMAFDYPLLELSHPWDITPVKAIELAILCDETARAVDSRITQTIGASVNTNTHYKIYANSHNFIGDYNSTMHGLSVSVLAEEDGDMERDYDYCSNRDPNKLLNPADIATKAALRTLKRLHARKVETTRCPVIFEARAAKSLISHCIAAITGTNLYRKSSFLVDQLGAKIFPSFITMKQHPHLLGGYGSTPFDDQGVKTRELAYIEEGVLSQYVLGAYSARKLGMQSTGNAGGVFNLSVNTGSQDLIELCKAINTGLLVTELMGQGVNLMTGDYSRGASGFWIENGEIQYPVNETTIACNLKEMFSSIEAVGNDIDLQGNIHTGSIVIGAMMIA